MELFNSLPYGFSTGLCVGIIITIVLMAMVVFIRPSRLGFKTERKQVSDRWFYLLQLSAQQRVDYLKRCGEFEVESGFQLMRRDLEISADLIALHLRRWFIPHRFLMFQIKRLPDETIYQLFHFCVRFSNIPFDIKEREDLDETKQETVSVDSKADKTEIPLEDDWDYLEEEKKPRPAAPQ